MILPLIFNIAIWIGVALLFEVLFKTAKAYGAPHSRNFLMRVYYTLVLTVVFLNLPEGDYGMNDPRLIGGLVGVVGHFFLCGYGPEI